MKKEIYTEYGCGFVDGEKEARKSFDKLTSHIQIKLFELRAKVKNLYPEIAHGDEEHRKWLEEKLQEYFKDCL